MRLKAVLGIIMAIAAAFLLSYQIPEQRMTDSYTYSGILCDVGATVTINEGRSNINTATYTDLSALHGIGPKLSEAIIAERESNGYFYYP